MAEEDLPDEKFRPNFPKWLGGLVRAGVRPDNYMGQWTGLGPDVGPPVSGALLGAGLGALYHGVRNRLMPYLDGEDRSDRRLLKPLLIGALAGAGVGKLASAEKSANTDTGRLVMTILQDPTLTELQKQNALSQLARAPEHVIRRLLFSSAGGALSGAIIASVLSGAPAFGGGLLDAFTGGGYTRTY